eukprot:jgi/Mesvir1/8377/Mv24077-RA.1
MDTAEAKNPLKQLLSPENIQHNVRVAQYCNVFMAIVAGIVTGILGLTGLAGFLSFFSIMALTYLGLLCKTGFHMGTYFMSWDAAMDDVVTPLLTHVLFWTYP